MTPAYWITLQRTQSDAMPWRGCVMLGRELVTNCIDDCPWRALARACQYARFHLVKEDQ